MLDRAKPEQYVAKLVIGFASTLLWAMPAKAVSPDTVDPRAIMTAVEKRESGDLAKGRLVINITDGAGRSRQRVVRSWSMDFDGGTRQLGLSLIKKPARSWALTLPTRT